MAHRCKGVIDRLHATFGFIVADGAVTSDPAYFFIPSAIQRTNPKPFAQLTTGTRVEFIPIESDRGPRAIEIRTLD